MWNWGAKVDKIAVDFAFFKKSNNNIYFKNSYSLQWINLNLLRYINIYILFKI